MSDFFDALRGSRDDKIKERAYNLRIDSEARKKVRQIEDSLDWTMPDSRWSLVEDLAIEDPPVEWEIEGLHERGTNVVLAAQYKTGKTTLALNVLRSLVDGEPFLGRFPVMPLAGRVAWWNFELNERQARRWLREMGISNPVWASMLTFRGRKLSLNSDHARDAMVTWLRERRVQYLIVDPFGSAYGGAENSNDEVREWTRRLDEMKALAGVESVLLVTHTGRGGQEPGFEHARGASKLDDWADVRWVYARDKEDAGNSARYLYAHGRDVDVEEFGLTYDEETRRLVASEKVPARGAGTPSRRMSDALYRAVTETPGLNQAELLTVMGGRRAAALAAIKRAVGEGWLVQGKGTRNEYLYTVNPAIAALAVPPIGGLAL